MKASRGLFDRAALVLAIVIAGITVIVGGWLGLAAWVWSVGMGVPFYPLAWVDAFRTQTVLSVWRASWGTDLWLVAAAAAPTAVMLALIFAAGLGYVNRRQITGWMMLWRNPPAKPWSSHPPEMTHGDARFADVDNAAERLRR